MPDDDGLISRASRYSVDETLERLQDFLRVKGVTVFALIDHSGEAEKVGMAMRPTKLLIFGSPRSGTPLMIAAPSVAVDLPPGEPPAEHCRRGRARGRGGGIGDALG